MHKNRMPFDLASIVKPSLIILSWSDQMMRRQVGKMLFYSFNQSDPIFKPFKIFISIALLRPLIDKMRSFASEVVLYGSCARGEDSSRSDVDLFIVSEEKEEAQRLIRNNKFLKGFEHLKIEPVIFSPVELLKSEKDNKEFLSLVREGIVLWDKTEDEAEIQGLSESRQDYLISPRKAPRR